MSETNPRKIQRILIVGGGSAGWMAAAYLRRRTDCAITLVESAQIGTIGVGEATIPSLVHFVHDMGLDEDEFMRRCNATYKLAIQFIDWVDTDHDYWHPFGLSGGVIDGIDLYHFWRKTVQEGASKGPYSHYSIQALLAQQGKSLRPLGEAPVVQNYAYHLDAHAFGAYLREIAVAEGVEHLVDDVSNVVLEGPERIARVETEGGRSLEADLFVDCTGFRGLLIEEALGDPFIDWSDTLLVDRAIVLRLPRDDAMPPYTRSTGLDAGWVWRIPLNERTGCGYVHSSRHTDDDSAAREILRYTGEPESRAADLMRLKMRVGRRQHFFKGNCVSLGLAAGFIEPLESTGIYFIQRALELLIDYFPDTSFDGVLAETYNRRMSLHFQEVRDFVLLHYVLSKRDDQAFWRDARNVALPDSLQEWMARYQATGLVEDAGPDSVFHETNFHHICSGGGYLPKRALPRTDLSDFDSILDLFTRIRAQHEALAEGMPSHAELVSWLHS